jgi:hypothetical protein
MRKGPQVSWTEPHELHIVFDPKLAHEGVLEFYSVTSLYDGAVKIRISRSSACIDMNFSPGPGANRTQPNAAGSRPILFESL